jgi:hypothetical protein
MVKVGFGGHKGLAIVKRNYGGDGVSVPAVANDPNTYLKAVTVMFQREAGYDEDTDTIENSVKADNAAGDEIEEIRVMAQGDPGSPSRHFRMHEVADLPPEEANRLYDVVKGALTKGYAYSGF